jgi:hypothetical protein
MANTDWAKYTRQYQEREDAYRATLSMEELRDYRQHVGEIADCPSCGALDVGIEGDEHPDVVGTSSWAHYYPCCGSDGHSFNSALELRQLCVE